MLLEASHIGHKLFLTYCSIENQTYHRQGSQAVLFRGAFDHELVRVLLSFLQLGNIVLVEKHGERLGGTFFGEYCLQRSGSQPGSSKQHLEGAERASLSVAEDDYEKGLSKSTRHESASQPR